MDKVSDSNRDYGYLVSHDGKQYWAAWSDDPVPEGFAFYITLPDWVVPVEWRP